MKDSYYKHLHFFFLVLRVFIMNTIKISFFVIAVISCVMIILLGIQMILLYAAEYATLIFVGLFILFIIILKTCYEVQYIKEKYES